MNLQRGTVDSRVWWAVGVPSLFMIYPVAILALEWILRAINMLAGVPTGRPRLGIGMPGADFEGLLLGIGYLAWLSWLVGVILLLGWRRGGWAFQISGALVAVVTLLLTVGLPFGWPFLAMAGALIYAGRRMRQVMLPASGLPDLD